MQTDFLGEVLLFTHEREYVASSLRRLAALAIPE